MQKPGGSTEQSGERLQSWEGNQEGLIYRLYGDGSQNVMFLRAR